MNIQIICNESSRFGNFCLSEEDFIMIIINIVVSLILAILLYRNYIIKEKNIENLSCVVQTPFTVLGEGLTSKYYQSMSVQQKNVSTKKKVVKNSSGGATNSAQIMDKDSMISEIRCNSCSNVSKVSYTYTLSKFIN